jgi:hypothetical protein
MNAAYAILVLVVTFFSTSAKQQQLPRPRLVTRWLGQAKIYQCTAHYLKKAHILNAFDEAFFYNHQLPHKSIMYRSLPHKTVLGSSLHNALEQAIIELKTGKKRLTNCTVLKDSEFNYDHCAGLIVLKSNQYPFVFKIFVEGPDTFLKPEQKGYKHGYLPVISKGLNRYLAGFGRLKNLEKIHTFLAQHPQWKSHFGLPRKWFWQPSYNRWFEVNGYNFGQEQFTIRLPSIYAIVADEIVSQVPFKKIKNDYKKTIFAFSKATNFEVDPNLRNFKLEPESGKLIIIDTEHFSSLLGFDKPPQAHGYFSLHVRMGLKAIYECFLKNKNRVIAENQD